MLDTCQAPIAIQCNDDLKGVFEYTDTNMDTHARVTLNTKRRYILVSDNILVLTVVSSLADGSLNTH
jgi:hypothetical protein